MNDQKRSADTSLTKCEDVSPEILGQVRAWILQGASEHDVTEAIEKKWPDVSARPAILATMTDIGTTARFDPEALVGWCIESTRYLYQRMVEVGDFPGALRAVKQLADFARKPIPLPTPNDDEE